MVDGCDLVMLPDSLQLGRDVLQRCHVANRDTSANLTIQFLFVAPPPFVWVCVFSFVRCRCMCFHGNVVCVCEGARTTWVSLSACATRLCVQVRVECCRCDTKITTSRNVFVAFAAALFSKDGCRMAQKETLIRNCDVVLQHHQAVKGACTFLYIFISSKKHEHFERCQCVAC